MGMEFQEVIKQISPAESDKPYLPFAVAVDRGMIKNPAEMVSARAGSPGVELANGKIPNHRGAGLIWFSNSIGAFDHIAVDANSGELLLRPASKEDVDHDGNIVNEGIIVLANDQGRLKIAALAIDVVRRPWLADKIGRRHHSAIGRVAVFPEISTELPEYEIHEVNSSEGYIRARERKLILPFGS